jgi:hypothetical protein
MEQRYKWQHNNPRKATAQPLSDVIADLLRMYKLQGKYNEVRLADGWNVVMGTMIASKTSQEIKPYVRNRKLFVSIFSPPLKHQLTLSKSLVIKKMNEYAGSEVIDDVVFL